VIPGTALGLVLAVAALGPGYVYLRVAERRSARPERSSLLEAVELAVVGALASTAALLVVGALADWTHVANAHWLAADPASYTGHHPLRLLWLVALTLGLAYLIAFAAAKVIHRTPDVIRPAGSAWTEAFINKCPKGCATVLTVELRDGRKVEGTHGAHTPSVDYNRELYLRAPLRVQAGPASAPACLDSDSFMVLRETDILAVSGKYPEATPGKHYSWAMDLRHAIEKIRPSVVQITLTADGLSESAIATLGGHGRMFSRPRGSGFFAASTGAVVTAKHVVDALPEWEDRCRRLGATHVHTGIGIAHLMPGGKRGVFTVVGCTVIATDLSHDLAVLLPQRNPFTGEAYATVNGDRVPLACDIACLDTARPQEGLPVGCSGYPLMSIALEQFASSAPHELPDRYLADMQINGGNSGGPVYSAVDSSVIGVAVASRLAPGVEAVPCRVEDAGLAVIVPSTYVAELLDANGIAWKQPAQPN
jgi:hypothetical protein